MSFSLRSLLLIPFVLQGIGITAVMGYLGYHYNQRLAADLANQAMAKTSDLIVQDLDNYLWQAHQINQIHVAAVQSGIVDLDQMEQLHRYLILQLQHIPEVTSLLLGTPQGEFRTIHRIEAAEIDAQQTLLTAADSPFEAGRSDAADPSQLNLFSVDQTGHLGRSLQTISAIDVRDRPWYRQAAETAQPGWSNPFQIGASNVLTINAYKPFYDANQTLQGVFSVNLSLNRLNQFLETLEISPNGKTFIVQRDGRLIANSAQQPVYIPSGIESLVADDPLAKSQPGTIQFQQLPALESRDPIIRDATQQLLTHFETFEAIQSAQDLSFKIAGDRLLLRIIPYQSGPGLDWLIVTVVPQSDFVGWGQNYLGHTIIASVLALGISIGVGLRLTGRIAQPLLTLNKATRAYRVGAALALPSTTTPIQEIETLTQTFGQMVAQLNVSFSAVQRSEQKFAKLLLGLPIGIGLFDRRGKLILLNPKGRRLLGQVSVDQPLSEIPGLRQVYIAGTNTPYPLKRLPVIRALYGSIVHVENLEIEANGQRIPLEVRAVPVLDEAKTTDFVLVAFQDISQRRQAEQLQHRYAQALERQVAEKTAQIQDREAQLKVAQRIAQVGSWEMDAQTYTMSWSEELVRIYGLEAIDTRPNYPELLDCLLPQEHSLMRTAIEEAISSGKPYELEHRLVRPDSTQRWVVSRGEAILDNQGQVVKLIGTVADISDRKAMTTAQDQQRLTLDLTQIGSWEFDLTTGKAMWSESHFWLMGLDPKESASTYQVWKERIHPEDLNRVEKAIHTALDNQAIFQDEHRMIYPDGTERWVFAKGKGIYNETGQAVRMVGVMMDVSDRKQTEAELQRLNTQLQQLARVDSLTQVANRFQLEESLIQEWQRAKRDQQPLTVLMLDIDHFKAYNDYYGHPSGDICLQQVAQAFKNCAHRPGDVVARYGGEEFVMLLPHTDTVGAAAMAERVRQAIAELAITNPKAPNGDLLTVSQGGVVVQMTTVTGINPQASIAQADAALYQAKQARNTYCIKLMTA
ncbi:MAG: diguanylate cyclase domain-containing protein [Leptolyngbyaceae cyanobacterium]